MAGVAIIAVLAAMLLAALSKAREKVVRIAGVRRLTQVAGVWWSAL